MTDDQRFMEIWLQTMKEQMPGKGEAIFKKSFSTLAVIALKKTTLYSVLGPFAWFLEDAMRLGVETFIEAGRRWWEIKRPQESVSSGVEGNFPTGWTVSRSVFDLRTALNTVR